MLSALLALPADPPFSPQAAAGCRAATVFMQYGIIANYGWLLVEGIYLHNLLVLAVFSERSYFTLYLCIGWGEDLLRKVLRRPCNPLTLSLEKEKESRPPMGKAQKEGHG